MVLNKEKIFGNSQSDNLKGGRETAQPTPKKKIIIYKKQYIFTSYENLLNHIRSHHLNRNYRRYH
jgi:hypothetical protein